MVLISFEIFSLGLKVTNNLAFLLLSLGACKTGIYCAKQTLPDVSEIIITSQSLNLPTFLRSPAKVFEIEIIKTIKENSKYFLIMDMDLGIFFEFH